MKTMPYVAYATGMGPGVASGFRPFASRLLGDYKSARFYVPTATIDAPGTPVTGGLGQIDLSNIPMWVWLAGGAAAFFLFFGGSGRGRRRG